MPTGVKQRWTTAVENKADSHTLAVKAGGCEVGDGTPVTAGTDGVLEAVVKLIHNVDLEWGPE